MNSWLDYFHCDDRFPRPDWERVANAVEGRLGDRAESWNDVVDCWLSEIGAKAAGAPGVSRSQNFRLLSSANRRHCELLLEHLERALAQILKLLPNIASDEGDGPHVVVEFSSLDDFYNYITPPDAPDSTHGLASGVFLAQGYGHFVFPVQELNVAEPVVVHELTHALLDYLPLPLWLNEGIAVRTEDALTGSWPLRMEAEQLEKHERFWDEGTIQEFWSGASFIRPDDGQHVGYELARYAVKSLSQEYELFSRFVNAAHFDDAGEAAALEHYEGSLGGLIHQFFGPGRWSPEPAAWSRGFNNSIEPTAYSPASAGSQAAAHGRR